MLGDSVRRRRAPARRPAGPPEPPKGILPQWGWRRWLPILAVALAVPFGIGYLVAVYLMFPPPQVSAGGIPVPELIGQTETAASGELSQLGLGPTAAVRLPHPSAPAGSIIAQSPLPGQQLRPGATVRVAVSTGVPRALVPDVSGFTEGRAAALLRRLGFEVARVVEEAEEPVGRVVRTSPEPGTDLALPARITIYVSSGPPPVEPVDTSGARWP